MAMHTQSGPVKLHFPVAAPARMAAFRISSRMMTLSCLPGCGWGQALNSPGSLMISFFFFMKSR